MRIMRLYTIGLLFIALAFGLGIFSRPSVPAMPSGLEAKAQEYREIAARKIEEERHCAIAKSLADQLTLLHGQANRMREEISLTLAQEGKAEGVR